MCGSSVTCLVSAEAGTSLFQMGSRGEDSRSEEIPLNRHWGRFTDRLKFQIPLRQYTAPTEMASGGRVEETRLKSCTWKRVPILQATSSNFFPGWLFFAT